MPTAAESAMLDAQVDALQQALTTAEAERDALDPDTPAYAVANARVMQRRGALVELQQAIGTLP